MFIFPVIIMFIIFVIQINCKLAFRLSVAGDKIYNLPYSWILCIVVPIIGWALLIVMYLYIIIWSNIKLGHMECIGQEKVDN